MTKRLKYAFSMSTDTRAVGYRQIYAFRNSAERDMWIADAPSGMYRDELVWDDPAVHRRNRGFGPPIQTIEPKPGGGWVATGSDRSVRSAPDSEPTARSIPTSDGGF